MSSTIQITFVKLSFLELTKLAFIGPGSPISNGSLVVGIQAMGVYIYKCIDKIQTECIRSLTVTLDAALDYNEHIQRFLERTVWVAGCRSWYKRGTVDGPVSLTCRLMDAVNI